MKKDTKHQRADIVNRSLNYIYKYIEVSVTHIYIYDYQNMSTLYPVSGSDWAPMSLTARGAFVNKFCGADIAHLPTPKFKSGPLGFREIYL